MESTGDAAVDAALTGLAREDPSTAAAARAGFMSLTWGEGLNAVTLLGLAEFCWYQLPVKWMCDLDEHLAVAKGLARLFTRLDMPFYADLAGSSTTVDVLTTYGLEGDSSGRKAFRKALDRSGANPPDVPGVLAWSPVMGVDENLALSSAAGQLELAMLAGELRPGAHRRWREVAEHVTVDAVTRQRPELDGASWLDRIHAERLGRWAQTPGSARLQRMRTGLVDQLVEAPGIPVGAQDQVAQLAWLLEQAATGDGVPLTQRGALTRPVLAEGAERFGWLTLGAAPRAESDLPEAWTLHEVIRELGLARRHRRQLRATPAGRRVHADGVEALWPVAVASLVPSDSSEAAAAEIGLLLRLHDMDTGYDATRKAVAEELATAGWRDRRTGAPINASAAGWLTGALHRRLSLLGLDRRIGKPAGGSSPLSGSARAAAIAALRTHALRPRTSPLPG